MQSLVIASFPAQEGKLGELKQLFRDALPDTRAFDGCLAIDVYVEEGTETIYLVEYWETLEQYEKYLNWRMETGLAEMLDPILAGGADALSIYRCGVKEDI